MAIYFLLGRLSVQGQDLLHEDPEAFFGNAENTKAKGARVLGQYAVLGRFDYVTMVEADDNETVARLSAELGRRNAMHFETLSAISPQFMREAPETGGGALSTARTFERESQEPKQQTY